MKSDYMFIKYLGPNMISSNTAWLRVTMVYQHDHMSRYKHDLRFLDIK